MSYDTSMFRTPALKRRLIWLIALGWSGLTFWYAYRSWRNYTPKGKCANCLASNSVAKVLDTGLQGIAICRSCVDQFANQYDSFEFVDGGLVGGDEKTDNPFQSPNATVNTAKCDFCDVADHPQIQFGKNEQFTICLRCVYRFKKRGEHV